MKSPIMLYNMFVKYPQFNASLNVQTALLESDIHVTDYILSEFECFIRGLFY